jgi:hypothetical protein
MHLTGTGASTAITFYEFAAEPDGDPDNWTVEDGDDCVCDASEVAAATFTELDAPGACGWMMARNVATADNTTPKWDNFRCGDNP